MQEKLPFNAGFLFANNATEYFAMMVGWVCGLIFAHTVYWLFKGIKKIIVWAYQKLCCQVGRC